jgi:TM2 domain-containing membrane protein YozV
VSRAGATEKSRTVAAILALLLGGLGAHHFYLGNTVLGVIYLVFCLTFIPALVALIEGIVFLCMSDEVFNAKYNS